LVQTLSAPELLGVWERGCEQPPVERGLQLLSAACPETTTEVLANLNVGKRDSMLLTLREWTFGPHMTGVATCVGCSGQLEMAFVVSDVRAGSAGNPEMELDLNVGAYQLRLRLPNSRDLIETSRVDLAQAPTVLLDHCLQSARLDGTPVTVSELPAPVVEAAALCMAEADPQADVQLAIECPTCGQRWHSAFDVTTFFWAEVEAWAARLLQDVHVLASAYSWSEGDILALTPVRRRHYLELAGAWATS
jgi:hypothetical protein